MFFKLINILLLTAVISSSLAVNDNEIEVDKKTATERTIYKKSGTKSELCGRKPCIRKCCSIGSVAILLSYGDNSGSCKSKAKLNLTLDLPNPPIFTNDLKMTEKELKSTFEIITGWKVIRDGWLYRSDIFLIQDGSLLHEIPNVYNRWYKYDVDQYCIDFLYEEATNAVSVVAFILGTVEQPKRRDYTASLIAMLISMICLIVTISVYASTRKLRRRLHGQVVIAFSACLLGYFITQSIYQLVYHIWGSVNLLCHVMVLPSYFLLLATFTWLNMLTFNIWLQLRWITESSNKHKGKSSDNLFCKFSLYGFGLPLVVTTTFGIINYLPMDRLDRSVITPGITNKSCFVGGTERALYIYIPVLALIAVNTALTAVNLYKMYNLRRREIVKDALKEIFISVSIVFVAITLGWLVDIATFFNPGMVCYVSDACGGITGLVVFLSFVCKKQVLSLIKHRNRTNRSMENSKKMNDDNCNSHYEALPTEVIT